MRADSEQRWAHLERSPSTCKAYSFRGRSCAIRIVAFLAILFLAAAVVVTATPIVFVSEAVEQREPIVYTESKSLTAFNQQARRQRVVITKRSPVESVLEFALPIDVTGRRINLDSISLNGSWFLTFGDTRLNTYESGATATFDIYANPLQIPFLQGPQMGIVTYEIDEKPYILNLQASEYMFRTWEADVVFGRLLTDNADFVAAVQPLSMATEAYLGMKRVPNPAQSSRFGSRIGALHNGFYLQVVSANVALGLASAFTLFLGLLIGLIIRKGEGSNAVAMVAGMTYLLLGSNAIAYIMPVSGLASWAILLFPLILCIKSPGDAWRRIQRGLSRVASAPLAAQAAVVASLALSTHNFGRSQGLALGRLQTDVGYYVVSSQYLTSNSIMDSYGVSNFLGLGFRSIDSAFVAFLMGIFSIDVLVAWQIALACVVALGPAVGFAFASATQFAPKAKWLLTWSFVFWAPLYSIIGEGYFSQAIGTVFSIISILFLAMFVTTRHSAFKVTPAEMGMTMAVPALVYTVLLFPIAAFLTVSTIQVIQKRISWSRIVTTALIFAGSINIGFLGMVNPNSALAMRERLNDIARWIVFPFHQSGQDVVLFATGSAPYAAFRFQQDWYGGKPISLLLAVSTLALVIFLVFQTLQLKTKTQKILDWPETGGLTVLAIVVMLLMSLNYLAAWSSGLYGQMKFLFTLAALVPTLIAVLWASLLEQDRPISDVRMKMVSVILAVTVGSASVVSFETIRIESSAWRTPIGLGNSSLAVTISDVIARLEDDSELFVFLSERHNASVLTQRESVLLEIVSAAVPSSVDRCQNCSVGVYGQITSFVPVVSLPEGLKAVSIPILD